MPDEDTHTGSMTAALTPEQQAKVAEAMKAPGDEPADKPEGETLEQRLATLTPEARAAWDEEVKKADALKTSAAVSAGFLDDGMEAERLAMEAQHKAEEEDRTKQAEADAADRKDQEEREAAARANAEAGLRTDGPTLAEFVEAGDQPEDYPPRGFAVVTDQSRAEAHPAHPISRIWLLEQRVADLERKFKGLHL